MVHALEEVHRLLKPHGILIDIHPFPEPSILKVIRGDQVLFAEPKRESPDEDIQHADRAVEQVLDRKLFEVERRIEIDFWSLSSSVSELREFWDDYGAFDEEPKDEAVLTYQDGVYARAEEILEKIGRRGRGCHS